MEYLLLIIILRAVTAVKLPGIYCPDVPLSHENLDTLGQLFLSYSIPFSSEVPTHLFRDMSKKDIKDRRFSIMIDLPQLGRVELLDKLHMMGAACSFVGSRKISADSAGYTLQSDIIGAFKDVLCDTSITEKVHFWMDGPYKLLWSCEEGRSGKDHEEALLITEDYEITMGNSTTEESLRAVALKFVSQELVDLIDLEKHIDLRDGLAGRAYRCPRNRRRPVNFVAPLLLLLIGIEILATIALYCYLEPQESGLG